MEGIEGSTEEDTDFREPAQIAMATSSVACVLAAHRYCGARWIEANRMRPPGLLAAKDFAGLTDVELHQVKMESEPGSNYWEWAIAEQQERQRVAQNRNIAGTSPGGTVTSAGAFERQMKIFWSWQSDTPGKIGRFLVRDALKDAIEELREASEIEEPDREALHLDHDIQDVTGSPDLARTIFGKIETSEVVIADVTVVGQALFNADGEKKLINSNVAIELGYAFHACTDQRVLLVFNEYYGSHKDLPFDLRHKGGAIVFNLPPNADKKEIEAQRKILKNRFVQALRLLLERKARRPKVSIEENKFTFNKAAYFGAGEVLIQPDCAYQGGGERLCYLRLIPKAARPIPIEFATLKDVVLAAPLLRDGNYESVRHDVNRYGAITCTSTGSRLTASTQLFQNGEIWCTSASVIKAKRENGVPQYINLPYVSIFRLEQIYYDTVRALFKFAAKELKLEPPWDLELGLCEIAGLYLNVGNGQKGPVHTSEIIQRTLISDSANATIDQILLSFFSKVFDCAGERRPTNLYGFPPDRPNATQE